MLQRRGLAIALAGLVAGGTALLVVIGSPEPARSQTAATLQDCLNGGGRCEAAAGEISVTSTLVLSVKGVQLVGRNTTLQWDGPASQPMVVVQAPYAEINGFTLLAGSSQPSTGIELRNYPANPVPGAPAVRNRIVNVRIGEGSTQTMDYGVRITGDENGDSNHFESVAVEGARVAAFDLQNPQAVNNNFVNVRAHWSGTGFRAQALNSHGTKAGPLRNTITDIGLGGNAADFEIGPMAGVDVRGMYSELSRRLALSSGSLAIQHGYWQRCSTAAGQVCPGGGPVSPEEGVVRFDGPSAEARLRLTDVAITPFDGRRERAVGIAPDRCFLSEVALDCTSQESATTTTSTPATSTTVAIGPTTTTASPSSERNVEASLSVSPGVAVVCPPAGKRIRLLAYDLMPTGGEASLRDGAGPVLIATLAAGTRTTWQDPSGRDLLYCLTAHGPPGADLRGTVSYRLV